MKLFRVGRQKKGFFFTLDVLLAIGILVVGFVLIMAAHSFRPIETQTVLFAEDFIDVFASTKVSDSDNEDVFKMWCSVCEGGTHVISAKENTLLEQIGEFYHRKISGECEECIDYAKDVARKVGQGLINNQFSYLFKFETEILINETNSEPKNSRLLISSKRLVYGVHKDEIFGPYVAEVQVWQ